MDARTLRDRLERIKKGGARGADLLYEHETGHDTSVQRGRLVDEEAPVRERLSVRVWLEGGKTGAASGTPDRADELVASAIGIAEQAQLDPHAGPFARQSGALGGLGLLDRRYEQVTPEDRAEVVTQAEKSVRSVDRRLSASDFIYRDRRLLRRFANTRGIVLEEQGTLYVTSGTVSGPEDLVMSDRIESRTFASIASLPYGINLANRMVDLLGPAIALWGPVRVLLPPIPTARLFGTLAERFDAGSFEPGGAPSFFLQPRPGGAPSVDPKIHMQDDGTLPGGLRTTSFDERGVCPVSLTLLREGRVDGRYVDPELAHRREVRPTGHLSGGVNRPRNLLLRSGTRSMSATLSDLGGRVLQIDDLPGLPEGLDLKTGAFRRRVSGVVFDGNKPVGAVRGLMLSGDLRVVLNQVVEICSDTDRIGHIDAPGMVVDGFVAEEG